MISGLTSAQARTRLEKYGPNLLPQKGGSSAFKILISQLQNPFALILMIAVVLSFVVGDLVDALLIASILFLNTALGFWQEYKASKELEALRGLEVIFSRVIRDGSEVKIPSHELVPWDLVVLESGDKIPADGKVVESYSLQINESVLTGESLPVVKTTKADDSRLYLGTTVVSGRAKYLVDSTGSNTRFGAIAKTLDMVEDEKTPLEQSLSQFITLLGIAVVLAAAAILLIRLLAGFDFVETLLVSIALLVAAVPEGLPAVVTIVLALGVHRMYLKKALIRKMVAVESLGGATVILSDKTGTLTKNEMRVKEVEVAASLEEELFKCATLCNSTNLVLKEGEDDSYDVLGDTTEGALLIWAKEKGWDIDLLRTEGKLVEETPFSLERRMMSVVWERNGKRNKYSKGAPEAIFKQVKIEDKQIEHWDKIYQKMASQGLRVLAFAQDHKFLGLIGIADQIRAEAKEAIRVAKQAGIKVVMVTGDNELTAKTVAEELGLLSEGEEVLGGAQVLKLTDEQLIERIDKIRVFARITPEEKLRLVKVYQSLNEVVAVTGDGVNDALALKQAQVGVAMGRTGTDVAKEASDIVLLDDNFATLISAVEQGRVIYHNILKVIKFLLTGNFSEILLIGVASFLALPSPLLPTQILWINFVTDGLPALALGFDSPSSNVMRVSPRKEKNILNASMMGYILIGGGLIAAICLIIFYFVNLSFGLNFGRGSTFTLMVVLQMCLPFIIRRHHSLTSNKKLLASVILVLVMQVLILTVPQLRAVFKL